jgi:hypothetical protein
MEVDGTAPVQEVRIMSDLHDTPTVPTRPSQDVSPETTPGTLIPIEALPPLVTASHTEAPPAQMPAPLSAPGVVPPVTAPPAAAPKPGSSGWRKVALFAVIALVVGAGAGFAAGMPGKSDMTKQRDAAIATSNSIQKDLDATRASLTAATAELATTKATLTSTVADLDLANADLTKTKADLSKVNTDLTSKVSELTSTRSTLEKALTDLAGTQKELTAMTSNRDLCQSAAVAGTDLANQWENVLYDIITWLNLTYGSPQEQALDQHISEQLQKMDEQRIELDNLVADCRAG